MIGRRRRGRARRYCAVALMTGLVATTATQGSSVSQAADRGDGGANAPNWVKRFPLGMSIPVSKSAKLGEGYVRKRRWAVFAYRPRGASDAEHVCVDIASIYYGSGQGGSFEDGSACGSSAAGSAPVIEESGFSIKKSRHQPEVSTIVAIAVPAGVSHVHLDLASGSFQSRKVRAVAATTAHKANLTPFGIVVFDLARRECVISVEGLNENSETVTKSTVARCG